MMIRINLLPGYKRKLPTDPLKVTQTILMGIMLLIVVICIILAYIVSAKLEETISTTQSLNAQKATLQTELAALPQLQSTIADLQAREKLLAKLTNLRIGPQHLLDDLSRILTYPQNALQLKTAQQNGWTLSWDVESVYLTKLEDIGDGQVHIEGVAKSLEDISELWLRLKTSPLMRNVRLLEIRENKVTNSNTSILQQFSFNAEANFFYQTKDPLKEEEQDQAMYFEE